jgi:kynureninase
MDVNMDFAVTRDLFYLPEGVIYLDGNSLGPLPKTAAAHVQHIMENEWGQMLIRGWNEAGWFAQPRKVGDRIARLIGAEAGSVTVGDTLSIRVFQALASALDLAEPSRKIILSDTGNFPTDLYMAQGLVTALARGHELKTVAPDAVEAALSHDVAVLMLTEVDYRTGRKHDMATLTAKARNMGIITIWDLAHSAGALPVDLAGAGADFAAGCTYKFLNGGPGAPAFLYVAPRHVNQISPILPGWMGHDNPFAFTADYAPGAGVERMRIGTPPVIAMAALEASLDIWDHVDMAALRKQSIMLGDLLISEVARVCPDLQLVSPRDGNHRGSQVSFAFDHGYAAIQALIARGIVGDFRAPNIMRFGICPLYNGQNDIMVAASHISDVINSRAWDRQEFRHRKAVT